MDGSSPSLQLGAGDQGIMVGYACSETPQMLPLPVVLAHRLTSALTIARKSGAIQGLRPDGKAQVTVEYDEDGKPFRLDTVVLSAQHSPEIPADELCFELTDKPLTVPWSLAGLQKSRWALAWRCRTVMPLMYSPGAAWRQRGWSASCPLWIPATGARSMPLSAMWEIRFKRLRKIPGLGSLSSCLW